MIADERDLPTYSIGRMLPFYVIEHATTNWRRLMLAMDQGRVLDKNIAESCQRVFNSLTEHLFTKNR